jgi:hypothetical protein
MSVAPPPQAANSAPTSSTGMTLCIMNTPWNNPTFTAGDSRFRRPARARSAPTPLHPRGDAAACGARSALAVVALWAAAAAASAATPPSHKPWPLSDRRQGVSCEFYDGASRLAWARRGGDWRDADEAAHGDKPYATQAITATDGQTLDWDVTAIARRWQAGAQPAGGVLLRALSGGGSIRLHSREAASRQPRLIIEWSNGSSSTLAPAVDATMTCSSLSGKGDDPTLHVSGERSALLVFPFDPAAGASVRKARLELFSDKQFGASIAVGAFRLDAPFAVADKPRDGIAAAYPGDRGLARHPKVLLVADFESPRWLDDWSRMGSASTAERVERERGNGFEPLSGAALKVTVPRGKKLGIDLLYRFADKTGGEPEEMYFRYHMRLGDNWRPTVAGKMPGFAGTYGKAGWGGRMSDGTDGWSARGRYDIAGPVDGRVYPLGSYVYHAGMSKKYGDGWGWNLGPTGVVVRNRWYSVEQYTKLNTPGKDDGVLRAWLDGVLVFERTDLNIRESPELRIETVWFNVYHGGTKAAQEDLSLYIDNVVIASEYIGPMRER